MFSEVIENIKTTLSQEHTVQEALFRVCSAIEIQLEKYNWVGFYFMNHQSRKLHLGPYVGAPTDHTVIDFGKGICGQVAESGQSFLVEDVNAQSNYIACSIDVKSEIVVPMYLGDHLIGQIDIDSNTLNAFDHRDDLFLQEVNKLIADRFGDTLNEYVQSLG